MCSLGRDRIGSEQVGEAGKQNKQPVTPGTERERERINIKADYSIKVVLKCVVYFVTFLIVGTIRIVCVLLFF